MKATELLMLQHDEVDSLFKHIAAATNRPAKLRLFDEAAAILVSHDAIEREILYSVCERELGLTHELGVALAEHDVVAFCIHQADQARDEDHFEYELKVLVDVLNRHVEEEESVLFPKVEKSLGRELLEFLGARMEAKFKRGLQQDYRRPLHYALRRSLEGIARAPMNGMLLQRDRTAAGADR